MTEKELLHYAGTLSGILGIAWPWFEKIYTFFKKEIKAFRTRKAKTKTTLK